VNSRYYLGAHAYRSQLRSMPRLLRYSNVEHKAFCGETKRTCLGGPALSHAVPTSAIKTRLPCIVSALAHLQSPPCTACAPFFRHLLWAFTCNTAAAITLPGALRTRTKTRLLPRFHLTMPAPACARCILNRPAYRLLTTALRHTARCHRHRACHAILPPFCLLSPPVACNYSSGCVSSGRARRCHRSLPAPPRIHLPAGTTTVPCACWAGLNCYPAWLTRMARTDALTLELHHSFGALPVPGRREDFARWAVGARAWLPGFKGVDNKKLLAAYAVWHQRADDGWITR